MMVAPSRGGGPGRARLVRGLALLLLWTFGSEGAAPRPVAAGPRAEPIVLGLLGGRADGRGLKAAQAGLEAVEGLPGLPEAGGRPTEILVQDDGGTPAGLEAAVKALKARKVSGVVALPSGELRAAYAEAARRLRVPWVVVGPWVVDGVRGAGSVWHLGPSLVAQGVALADALRSPLGASSVVIVREPTALGAELAGVLERNRPPVAQALGTFTWEPGQEGALWSQVVALKPDWVVVAATGRHLESLAQALGALQEPPRCLFCDLSRCAALRTLAPRALEVAVLLGGPDPEGEGRVGEALLNALERAGAPEDEVAVRAAEAGRRLVSAARLSTGDGHAKLVEALAPATPTAGLLGTYAFEPSGATRFFPLRLWRVRGGRFQEWPPGLLPTPDCGPPLGFGRPPTPAAAGKGRLGWLTWGEAPVRTIEQDLQALHLTSGGYDPELDGLVRDEILARAIRIAHQLFRREPDGTAIPGWSWGLRLTTQKPAEIRPNEVWVATVAGDDPDAGGRVTGSGTVAVYSTFLRRTMYERHRLEPPLTVADKPFLLARHRWGEDRALNLRGQEVQCLVDGFASAIGLTLAHEFGHLCGCGHDTEHPTSIMNVVAGAGASWAEAVWIPAHQRNLTTTLGVEGVEK